MKKPKLPHPKYILKYKERVNYSVKTIDGLVVFLENHAPTIIKLNDVFYRVEKLEEVLNKK